VLSFVLFSWSLLSQANNARSSIYEKLLQLAHQYSPIGIKQNKEQKAENDSEEDDTTTDSGEKQPEKEEKPSKQSKERKKEEEKKKESSKKKKNDLDTQASGSVHAMKSLPEA